MAIYPMLSFIDAFYLMGATFVAMIPLLFLMWRPAGKGASPVAAME